MLIVFIKLNFIDIFLFILLNFVMVSAYFHGGQHPDPQPFFRSRSEIYSWGVRKLNWGFSLDSPGGKTLSHSCVIDPRVPRETLHSGLHWLQFSGRKQKICPVFWPTSMYDNFSHAKLGVILNYFS